MARKTFRPSKTALQEWPVLRQCLMEAVGDMGGEAVPLTGRHQSTFFSQSQCWAVQGWQHVETLGLSQGRSLFSHLDTLQLPKVGATGAR